MTSPEQNLEAGVARAVENALGRLLPDAVGRVVAQAVGDQLAAALSGMHSRLESLENKIEVMESEWNARLRSLEESLAASTRRGLDREARQRRSNFIIKGLNDTDVGETDEETEARVREFLDNNMWERCGTELSIERVHRLGRGATRNLIIVGCSFYKQKAAIMRKKADLRFAKERVFLEDDMPAEMRHRANAFRRTLLPMAKEKGQRLLLKYPFETAKIGGQFFTEADVKKLEDGTRTRRSARFFSPTPTAPAPPVTLPTNSKKRGLAARSPAATSTVGRTKKPKETGLQNLSLIHI